MAAIISEIEAEIGSEINPEIKKGRKFDQVLDGARDVFLRDGFEGASVDDIARRAGVSKATLYSYFPDKRLLFSEVARVECNRQAQAALAGMPYAICLYVSLCCKSTDSDNATGNVCYNVKDRCRYVVGIDIRYDQVIHTQHF